MTPEERRISEQQKSLQSSLQGIVSDIKYFLHVSTWSMLQFCAAELTLMTMLHRDEPDSSRQRREVEID